MSRALGGSGIECRAIGMGCWAIGGPFFDGEGTVTERGDEISVTRVGVGISGANEHSTASSEQTKPESSVVCGNFIPTLHDTMVTLPILGFKTLAQMEENAGVLALGPLTDREMREIAALLTAE